MKCLDPECCEPFQTNWRQIFKKGFIPPPAIYTYGKNGLEVVEPSVYFENQRTFTNQRKFQFATLQERLITDLMSKEAKFSKTGVPRPPPFDSYCPSMEEKLDDCVCEKCGSSWPCAAAKKRHLKAHSRQNITNESTIEYQEVTDEIESDIDLSMHLESAMDVEEAMPIIGNIQDHLAIPFEEITDEIDM